MKRYIKPKFTIITLSVESLLAASPNGSDMEEGRNDEGGPDAKRMTFRIFDDSFDDLSSEEESDYATTTNTIEVW